ncbi:hypothetical protein BDQ17DRAFT_1320928 [Cyathus striatus]|nr:hypothetical protein BDQ17DRAFT_1320928 [Cyathus striatus]
MLWWNLPHPESWLALAPGYVIYNYHGIDSKRNSDEDIVAIRPLQLPKPCCRTIFLRHGNTRIGGLANFKLNVTIMVSHSRTHVSIVMVYDIGPLKVLCRRQTPGNARVASRFSIREGALEGVGVPCIVSSLRTDSEWNLNLNSNLEGRPLPRRSNDFQFRVFGYMMRKIRLDSLVMASLLIFVLVILKLKLLEGKQIHSFFLKRILVGDHQKIRKVPQFRAYGVENTYENPGTKYS